MQISDQPVHRSMRPAAVGERCRRHDRRRADHGLGAGAARPNAGAIRPPFLGAGPRVTAFAVRPLESNAGRLDALPVLLGHARLETQSYLRRLDTGRRGGGA